MSDGGLVHDVGLSIRQGFAALIAAGALTACQPPSDDRWPRDARAAKRGLDAIQRVQCGACHDIPGVAWPAGGTGPSLHAFGKRGAIAGTLPNRPDVLAAFVRNAPSVKAGSPMPAMPVTQGEARDIAFYLYEAGQ